MTTAMERGADTNDERAIAWRVERALQSTIERIVSRRCPPRLRDALTYGVFPGGGRIRPRLVLSVAAACGDVRPSFADAAAVSVELVHCASLAHDDLPCFDDADERRGKPTVHTKFGEATAVLVGDALIVHAFEALALSGASDAIVLLAEATGAGGGIVAGQAWESETDVPLEEYHRAKTASLFEAAAGMGALASGADPAPWRMFGEKVGRAYQAADDLNDALVEASESGKTSGRDEALGRPSVVRALGVAAVRRRITTLLEEANSALPAGGRPLILRAWLKDFARHVRADG